MADRGETPALPDAAELRRAAALLLRDDLCVVPVRHHSPACALQLQRLFAAVAPSEVLIEGPRSFTELVPTLADPATEAPFAVYCYAAERDATDGLRRSAYYPFCDYSPELVALREATRRQLPVRFIDLEFEEQCASETDAPDPADRAGDAASLLDERHVQRSRHLRLLAERLGCRDTQELWEHLFEVDAPMTTPAEHVARVFAWCELARREHDAVELRADGTLAREAEMAWHVADALQRRAANAGPVLVVLGGFHAVPLLELLASPPPRPDFATVRFAHHDRALVRYDYERLERLNGYGAGMTSPQWHQLLWQRLQTQERAGVHNAARLRQDVAMTMLADIAARLREREVPLPLPALQAAYEHTLRLSALRQRRAPVREDVLDAVLGCFVKGDVDADGAVIRGVARRALTGAAFGKVPAGASVPPLVRDFALRARRQRLRTDDSEPRRVVLDLYRKPDHRRTSRLLHGLSLLAVPFAVRNAGPDFVTGRGLERLQEIWTCSFSPATEAALVEASVHGATVPAAVARRFADRLDALAAEGRGQDARAAAAMLTHACVLGLHRELPRVLDGLRRAIAADADFTAVADAAATLGLLWESREPLEAQSLDVLPDLLRSTFERATFLGRELREAPSEATPYVDALQKLRELLASAVGSTLDAELYHGLVAFLHRASDSSLLRGAAAGLLHTAGRLDDEALARELGGWLGGADGGIGAVPFLRGLLGTAREVAWQLPRCVEVIDALLQRWDEQQFVTLLPELRLAFASMTPTETDRVAAAVAALHDVAGLDVRVRHGIDAGEVQRNLELSAQVARVLADEGLDDWLGGDERTGETGGAP